MKIYKYEEKHHHSYRTSTITYFGTLEERKVDEFNDKIKVFVPIAYRDMTEISIRAEIKGATGIHFELAHNRWTYLSELNGLKEASKKDYKHISEQLRADIDDRASETQTYKELLEELNRG